MWVKICGITNLEDLDTVLQFKPSAVGFVLYNKSPRFVTGEALKKLLEHSKNKIARVAVTVNPDFNLITEIKDLEFEYVQLHGDETLTDAVRAASLGLKVIKAFRIDCAFDEKQIVPWLPYPVLLDTKVKGMYGGTGKTFNWDKAVKIKQLGAKIILSGGIGPDNVEAAVKEVLPWGIDASSKLEESPGKKSASKLRQFFEALNSALKEMERTK